MPPQPPEPTTLGALRNSGAAPLRSVREEIRTNLLDRLRNGKQIFHGVLGYEDTVIPAVENALLCGHDLIFLGERGQAKTRMIRQLTQLLDEWVPAIEGSEIHDDPRQPVSAFGRARVAELGDDTPVVWVHRDARYVEKLATPDVSIADLIGDVDPVKVAAGRTLADEDTMHFGLVPRTHRGIFCINELPDLTEKVQVGLFNVMEERDVQIKGYRIRLPIDVLVVASANPEDYTSRGRIITPLKDRYAAQVRTHYPPTPELELEVVRQEADLPEVPGVELAVPDYMQEILAEITFQARASPDVNQASGVSVRMSIANYETLAANAARRALAEGEAFGVPRISDLGALETSTLGKLELEYAGGDRSESEVARDLARRACKAVFERRCDPDALAPLVAAFDEGWKVEVGAFLPSPEYLAGLEQIGPLADAARDLAGREEPAFMAAAIEFLLEGLHLSNRLNKTDHERGARYARG
ncbi:MAG: sigma 54-interacting transcriptional regulator [Myxococcota bacterium]